MGQFDFLYDEEPRRARAIEGTRKRANAIKSEYDFLYDDQPKEPARDPVATSADVASTAPREQAETPQYDFTQGSTDMMGSVPPQNRSPLMRGSLMEGMDTDARAAPGVTYPVNRSFVDKLRDEVVGGLPLEKRMPALRELARAGGPYGAAAKSLLFQAERENAPGVNTQLDEEMYQRAAKAPLIDVPPKTSGTGPQPARRVAIPDITPTFEDQAAGTSEEEIAKRRAYASNIEQDRTLGGPELERMEEQARQAEIERFAAESPASYWIRDKSGEVIKGVSTGIKAFTDVFGAGNEASAFVQSLNDSISAQQTAQQRAAEQRRSEIMEEYADGGILDQLKGAAQAFAVDPVGLTFNTLGIMLPMVFGGEVLAGIKGVQAIGAQGAAMLGRAGSVTAANTAGSAISGGVMGAGFAKGAIYDSVLQMAKAEGHSDDSAKLIAQKAQSYTENPDLIALVAVATAAGAGTGLEPMILNMLGRESAKQLLKQGVIKSVVGGLAREVPLEMVQGGSEKLAANVASARAGFDVDPMRGVWTNAFLEGLASGGLAAIGGVAGSNFRLRDDTAQDAAARELSSALNRGQFTQQYVNDEVTDMVRRDFGASGAVFPEATTRPRSTTQETPPSTGTPAEDTERNVADTETNVPDTGTTVPTQGAAYDPDQELVDLTANAKRVTPDGDPVEDAEAPAAPTAIDPREYEGVTEIDDAERGTRLDAAKRLMESELASDGVLKEGEQLQASLATAESVGKERYESLQALATALKRARDIDVVIADFGVEGGRGTTTEGRQLDESYNGFYTGDGKTVIINARSDQLVDTLTHEPYHVLEAVHPDLFQPILDTSVGLITPKGLESVAKNYRLGSGELGKLIKAVVSNPTPQNRSALQTFLNDPAKLSGDRRARIARSEIVAHVAGSAAAPQMYASLVQRTGSPGKANEILRTVTEYLNRIYKALTGKTVQFLNGPQAISQMQSVMRDIENQWEQRVAAARRTPPETAQNGPQGAPDAGVTEDATPAQKPPKRGARSKAAEGVVEEGGEVDQGSTTPPSKPARRVLKTPDGQWAIYEDGKDEPVGTYKTKALAVANKSRPVSEPAAEESQQPATSEKQADTTEGTKQPAGKSRKPAKQAVDPMEPDDIPESALADEEYNEEPELRYSREDADADADAPRFSREYKLDVLRQERIAARKVKLSDKEVETLTKAAEKFQLNAEEVLDEARRIKAQFPEKDGWVPIEATGITTPKRINFINESKKNKKQWVWPVSNANGGSKWEIEWQPISYGFDKEPGQARVGKVRDRGLVDVLATRMVNSVLAVQQRAAAGDKNAEIIMGHSSWYRAMVGRLRDSYGGGSDFFADLLGAFSPNTPVMTNWRFAVEVMDRFARGDFDAEMMAYDKWMADGNSHGSFKGPQIRQASGKLYGMNSDNGMLAMYGLWRMVKAGTAPKARNFSMNLIGQSNVATIDVWAARMLRRMANLARPGMYKRIPPPAEQGVTGNHMADTTKIGGEFGFGADVMAEASKVLREKHGIDMQPPDLQAVAWFIEKELWGERGWTSKSGEGGSFEEEMDQSPMDRYTAGVSIQQDAPPENDAVALAQQQLSEPLQNDPEVKAFRVMPTNGMYAYSTERSFDFEVTGTKQFDPVPMIRKLVEVAAANRQKDVFVSRTLGRNEVNENARPGVEIYFKTERSLEAARPILEEFTNRGIDGFTFIVDPRQRIRTEPGADPNGYVGVRLQYVPEFFLRAVEQGWVDLNEGDNQATLDGLVSGDPVRVNGIIEAKRRAMLDTIKLVSELDGVAYAEAYNYDTRVIGQEQYQAVLGADAAGAASAGYRLSGRDGPVEQAAARLEASARRLGVSQQAGRDEAARRDAGYSEEARTGGGVPAGLRSAGASGEGAPEGGLFSRSRQYEQQVAGDAPAFNSRPIQPQAVELVGYHYSGARRATLSGSGYGSATSARQGQEYQRVMSDPDRRLRDRVYFYAAPMAEIPRSEPVVTGQNVHKAVLTNIYDPRSEDARPVAGGSLNESAVIDAGYDGYVAHEYGMVVLLATKPIPVQFIGTRQDLRDRILPNPVLSGAVKIAYPVRSVLGRDGMIARRPEGNQFLTPAQRQRVAEQAPSFAMEFGEYKVRPDQREIANNALEAADSGFRFSRDLETFATRVKAERIDNNRNSPKAGIRELVLPAPTDLMKMLGFGWGRPVIVEADDAVHAMRKHPEVTPQIFGRLPELLAKPRAVIDDPENGSKIFVLDVRDGSQNPIVAVLKQDKVTVPNAGAVKVVLQKTAYGLDSSADVIVRGLAGEGTKKVVWLPEKEIARVRGLLGLASIAAPPSGDPFGPDLAILREREGTVLSDSALDKYRADPNGDWRTDTVTIGIPADWEERGSSVRFSRTIEVDGVERPTTNSSGRPIHPTDEGIRNFWRGFAGSQIVDEQGRPRVMYHGTARDITAFRAKQAGAIFVTDDPEFAENFSALSENYILGENVEAMPTEQRRDFSKRVEQSIRRNYKGNPAGQRAMMSDLEGWVAGGRAGGELLDYISFIGTKAGVLGGGNNIMPLYVNAKNPFDYENAAHVDAVINAVGRTGDPYYDNSLDRLSEGDWGAIESERIQASIKSLGFDGFYVKETGRKNLAVYDPGQIKSATGNRGTFDPANPDIRFSRTAPDTPEFKRWFGDSKVVDAAGMPRLMYRGISAVEHSPVMHPSEITGLIWTSSSPNYASSYAGEEYGAVYPVYVKADRIFDYRKNGEKLASDFLRDNSWALNSPYWEERFAEMPGDDVYDKFWNGVVDGAWMALEVPEFVEFVKSRGYDGWYSNEGVVDNVAVFESSQVKSIFNERPTQSPDIRFSRQRAPITVTANGKDWFEAKAGAKTVGKMAVWRDSRDKLVAMNVFVSPQYRQRGVARMMYEAAEQANGEQLSPAISLSDDAFEFWKRFRPEAVAQDLRHWKDQIIGARAVWKNKPGTIISASGRGATIEYDSPTDNGGTQSVIMREELSEAIEAAGGEPIDFSPRSDTRFSRQPIYGDNYDIKARNWFEQYISNVLSNERSRIRSVQNQIVDQGGKVSINTNIDIIGRIQTRKSGQRVERFRKTVVEPLMKTAGKAGIETKDIALYLYAKFAPERNVYIAGKNPAMPDGGSGMTDQEAADEIQRIEQKYGRVKMLVLKSVAMGLQKITKDTQRILIESGLIDEGRKWNVYNRDGLLLKSFSNKADADAHAQTQGKRTGNYYRVEEYWGMADKWNAVAPNYVPLKGFEAADDQGKATGSIDPRDNFSKRALGRNSRAGEIIENILKDYERAVLMAADNEIKKAFGRFVLENPDDTLWEINKVVMTRKFMRDMQGGNPLSVADGIVNYSYGTNTGRKDTVAFRAKGEVFFVTVKDPSVLADMNRVFAQNEEAMQFYFRAWGSINRGFSKIYTTFSPVYVLFNFGRDVFRAPWRTWRFFGPKRAAKVFVNTFRSIPSIRRAIRTNNWTGGASKYEQYFNEFREEGGAMGVVQQISVDYQHDRMMSTWDQYQQAIATDPKSWAGPARKYLNAAIDFVVDYNSVVEQSTRVASYVAHREDFAAKNPNATPEQIAKNKMEAAHIAANITVDFARRGKAASLMSSLFLFFNPAVQGTVNDIEILFGDRNESKARRAFFGIGSVTPMIVLGYFAASMAAGMVGDDDEKYWDSPAVEDIKRKSLLFFTPEGGEYRMPMAYGAMGFFTYFGGLLHDVIEGGKPTLKAAQQLLSAFFVHFSPLGALDQTSNFVAPTPLDPVLVLSGEVTEQGRPLLPGQKGDGTPDSQRFWPSTRGTAVQRFTEWLNAATGGDTSNAGLIDVSPESLKYVTRVFGGGPGTLISDSLETVWLTKELGFSSAVEKNKVPIFKSFVRSPEIRTYQARFNENVKEVQAAAKSYREQVNNPEASDRTRKRLQTQQHFAALKGLLDDQKKALRGLRDQEVVIIDSQMDDVSKLLAREALDEQRKRLYVEFNRAFAAAKVMAD